MAKKTSKKAGGRSRSSSKSESTSSEVSGFSGISEGVSNLDLQQKLREFASNETVQYIAAGLATAMLARFASKISDKYPEISTFIKDNLDIVEGKFEGKRPGGASSAGTRH